MSKITTIDITSTRPVNVTPMSVEEARDCVNAIKQNIESLRLMVLELKRRNGWEALGYKSWVECAQAEFNQGRAYIFRLVQAAEVEENLKSTIVDSDSISNIPTSQLAKLAQLPPQQQLTGLKEADILAASEGKERTAAHVSRAVKTLKGQLNEQQKSAGLGTWNGKQVLPDCERTTDAPPQELTPTAREFTVTVAGAAVRVVVTPSVVKEYPTQYEFFGMAISQTGYKCEFVGSERLKQYPNEQACAIALATQFYEELLKLKKGNGKTSDQRDEIVAIDGDRSKLPPWLQAYLKLKDGNPETIVLVKVGDFYETYLDDAKTFASATEVILTSKSAGASDRVPMAGISIEAIAKYTTILDSIGLKTVIDNGTDQQSNPNSTSTPVAVDTAMALNQEEPHIPGSLANCGTLDEAVAYLEQAAPSEVWQEVRCLSSATSDPLRQAIALYKTLSPAQQREFCRVIGLEMPEAALAKC